MMLDDEDGVAAVRAALRKPTNKAKGFDAIKVQVKLVMRKGYSVAQLLNQVRTTVNAGPSLKWH